MSPRSTTPAEKIPCPECGQLFSRRGLPGHRRFKHATVAAGPPAPLPSESPSAAPQGLDLVVEALVRIEQRLARLEASMQEQRPAQRVSLEALPSLAPEARREAADVRVELDEILLEVAALRTTPIGIGESTEEREARHARLGSLRRRQAELMYQLGRDDAGEVEALMEGLMSEEFLDA